MASESEEQHTAPGENARRQPVSSTEEVSSHAFDKETEPLGLIIVVLQTVLEYAPDWIALYSTWKPRILARRQ